MTEHDESLSVAVKADTTEFARELREATRIGRQFGDALTSAFADIALRGRTASDTVRSLALSLSQMTLRAAFRPLESALGTALAQALGGLPAGGASASGSLPLPFAHGGVIASPVTFPLAGGQSGIAGERGSEAILPLARGSDGRLGVAALGAGGGDVMINFHVTASDADSFRRSESQIAAMLSRAVGRGHRNL